jgi:hypothetical protein
MGEISFFISFSSFLERIFAPGSTAIVVRNLAEVSTAIQTICGAGKYPAHLYRQLRRCKVRNGAPLPMTQNTLKGLAP